MIQDSEREARQAEAAKIKQREGSGAVPNVTEDEVEKKTGEAEVKEAIHEFEEEKGDWSKSRG
jgi:hypothetical protein